VRWMRRSTHWFLVAMALGRKLKILQSMAGWSCVLAEVLQQVTNVLFIDRGRRFGTGQGDKLIVRRSPGEMCFGYWEALNAAREEARR
jgi:hypothetical protein